MNRFFDEKWLLVLVLCLTLGLAPFTPEPHILGKVRWLAGGAEGMAAVDYFDLLLHGLPWIILLFMTMIRLRKLLQR